MSNYPGWDYLCDVMEKSAVEYLTESPDYKKWDKDTNDERALHEETKGRILKFKEAVDNDKALKTKSRIDSFSNWEKGEPSRKVYSDNAKAELNEKMRTIYDDKGNALRILTETMDRLRKDPRPGSVVLNQDASWGFEPGSNKIKMMPNNSYGIQMNNTVDKNYSGTQWLVGDTPGPAIKSQYQGDDGWKTLKTPPNYPNLNFVNRFRRGVNDSLPSKPFTELGYSVGDTPGPAIKSQYQANSPNLNFVNRFRRGVHDSLYSEPYSEIEYSEIE